jgi:hypothetical protein
MTETPLIAICLAGQAASCNGTTTFTVDSRPNQPRDYVTRRVDSTRQEAEGTAARADALTFPPDPGAGLAAHPDRDQGWSPWPTPNHQTRMIASTAPTVLTSSTPASSRPSANCTKPWPATPDDLAGLPADMKRSSVAVGELLAPPVRPSGASLRCFDTCSSVLRKVRCSQRDAGRSDLGTVNGHHPCQAEAHRCDAAGCWEAPRRRRQERSMSPPRGTRT